MSSKNKYVLEKVHEIETHCALIRREIETAKKKHKKVNFENGLYDPISYHTFIIACHNDGIRAALDKTHNHPKTILSNGTDLAW